MEESALLEKLYRKEKELQLDDVQIKGIPLWRVVRYYTRLHYINAQVGYVATTGKQMGVGPKRLKLFSGFWNYLFKKDLTLLFTFNRLVKNKGQYLDKLTDPVVEESFIKESNYVIIDPPNYVGDYPRIHKEHTVSNERRTVSMQLLKHMLMLICPLLYNNKVKQLFNKAKVPFELPDSFVNKYYSSLAVFLTEYYYYKFWLLMMKPRRVLLVFRGGYFGLIAACKSLSIPVAEFQHGITLDKTVSYTGDYDQRIDPDYFLTFGSYWKSHNFGMTEERTFCIGWAYSQMMKREQVENEKIKGTALVVSSPEISDMVLDALSLLSQWNPQVKYHIRLHPSESYNEEQRGKLANIPQAELVDNSNDSATVLPLYEFVLGENSSVLYEALSIGCRVGLLKICGLCPPVDKPGINSSFYIIEKPVDYLSFFNGRKENSSNNEFYYSDFDNNKFKKFLDEKM